MSRSAPSGRSVAQDALERRGDLVDVLAGREPDGDVRLGGDRKHRLLQDRLAAGDAIHVHRRAGQRP